MQLSSQGLTFVASKEAIYLYGYKDAVGIWTVGAGHTAAAGGLKPGLGTIVTLEGACALFAADMAKYGATVERILRGPLKQFEFDGMASFHFNTGAIGSGSVDDRWNRGDKAGALVVLNQYTKAGGKRLNGLVTRRAEETRIIRDGTFPLNMRVLVKARAGDSGRMMSAAQLPWGGSPTEPPAIAADVMRPVAIEVPQPKPNFIIDLGKYLWSLWK